MSRRDAGVAGARRKSVQLTVSDLPVLMIVWVVAALALATTIIMAKLRLEVLPVIVASLLTLAFISAAVFYTVTRRAWKIALFRQGTPEQRATACRIARSWNKIATVCFDPLRDPADRSAYWLPGLLSMIIDNGELRMILRLPSVRFDEASYLKKPAENGYIARRLGVYSVAYIPFECNEVEYLIIPSDQTRDENARAH